jgi:hypothetical protein
MSNASHLKHNCNNSCRMVAPRLKNLEGLLSIEADSDNGSKLEAYAKETMDASLCWKCRLGCTLEPSFNWCITTSAGH